MSSTTAGFSTVNRFAVLEDHQPKSKSKKQTGSDGDVSIKQRQGKENGKVDGGSKSNGVDINGHAKVNGTSNGNGNGNGKKQDHASQRSSNTQTVDSQTRSTTVNGKTPHSTTQSKSSVPTAYLKTPAKKSSKSSNTQKPTLHSNDTFDQDQDQAQMKVNGVTQQMKMKHLTKDLSKKEHEVKEVKERVVQKKKKTDWEVPRKTLHGSIGEQSGRFLLVFTFVAIHVSILIRLRYDPLPRFRLALPYLTGFLVLYLRSQTPLTLRPLLTTLTTALIIITSTDVLRFNSPSFNKLYIKVCGPLMRKEEVKGWNGVIWYLIGVVVTLGVYPRDVAVVSILT
jgi:hypothetical protein